MSGFQQEIHMLLTEIGVIPGQCLWNNLPLYCKEQTYLPLSFDRQERSFPPLEEDTTADQLLLRVSSLLPDNRFTVIRHNILLFVAFAPQVNYS